MKKILWAIAIIFAGCGILGVATSCDDTQSYSDLVNSEKKQIRNFINLQDISYKVVDEDWVNEVTDSVLKGHVDPAKYIDLNQWYMIDEGDFKRLYFKINNWGKNYPDFDNNKFEDGSNVLVRYDSCYNLADFVSFDTLKANNLDPNSFETIYRWRTGYYANTTDTYYYGSKGTSDECTSAGMAFPVRFLWAGGEASLIVPFSLGSTDDQSYYMTLFFGKVTYKEPHYLPE